LNGGRLNTRAMSRTCPSRVSCNCAFLGVDRRLVELGPVAEDGDLEPVVLALHPAVEALDEVAHRLVGKVRRHLQDAPRLRAVGEELRRHALRGQRQPDRVAGLVHQFAADVVFQAQAGDVQHLLREQHLQPAADLGDVVERPVVGKLRAGPVGQQVVEPDRRPVPPAAALDPGVAVLVRDRLGDQPPPELAGVRLPVRPQGDEHLGGVLVVHRPAVVARAPVDVERHAGDVAGDHRHALPERADPERLARRDADAGLGRRAVEQPLPGLRVVERDGRVLDAGVTRRRRAGTAAREPGVDHVGDHRRPPRRRRRRGHPQPAAG
jgi:hypothetical protein